MDHLSQLATLCPMIYLRMYFIIKQLRILEMPLELDIDISFKSDSELKNVFDLPPPEKRKDAILLSDAGILYFITCTYPYHACDNCQVL